MKINHYLLLFLFFGLSNSGFSQIVITTKVGGLWQRPTYLDEFSTYQAERKEAGVALALAFRKELGQHFALGTELGFNSFTTQLEVTSYAGRMKGDHLYQQVYLAFLPRYSLTKKPSLVFIDAGAALFLNTKGEFRTVFDVSPMNIGNATVGLLGGIGINPRFGKMGIELEIRSAFQNYPSSVSVRNAQEPERFNLYYTSLFLGLSYYLD